MAAAQASARKGDLSSEAENEFKRVFELSKSKIESEFTLADSVFAHMPTKGIWTSHFISLLTIAGMIVTICDFFKPIVDLTKFYFIAGLAGVTICFAIILSRKLADHKAKVVQAGILFAVMGFSGGGLILGAKATEQSEIGFA